MPEMGNGWCGGTTFERVTRVGLLEEVAFELCPEE